MLTFEDCTDVVIADNHYGPDVLGMDVALLGATRPQDIDLRDPLTITAGIKRRPRSS